jgi:multidrug efflux system outer membrane protein
MLVLVGCAVGPNYHPPKTEVSAAFANGNEARLVANPVAIAWWRGFNDATLNELIDKALATNQDMRIATSRVLQARALHSSAQADFFPVLGGTAGYTKSRYSEDSLPGAKNPNREIDLYDVGFDATWELDIFGRVRRSTEATRAELSVAEANRQEVWITLIAEVARNYFELRGGQNHLAVARRNADNQRESLDITVARLRAGRANELDTAQARAQLNSTLATVPPLEAAIKHSIHRLSVLLGQPPAALDPTLAQPAPKPPIPATVEIGNPTDLLRRRPDVRAAERSLAAATALIGVETSSLFPRVTFQGNAGFSASQIAELGGPGTDAYSFGPRITWAALDLGHVRARIKAARAQADVELANYEKTVLLALEETENALVDFGREQARRDFLRESEHSAAEANTLARQRYDSGVADFLPVLDAERTQLDVQAQLAQSETRVATSLVAIYKALGGGWEIETKSAEAERTTSGR